MKNYLSFPFVAIVVALGIPAILSHPTFAEVAGISNVESFIKSVITVLAGLAGLVATGFFVLGGFSYITSAGNPERMDGAKRTITFSAIGLIIVISAFALSTIVTDIATKAFGK